MPLKRFEDPEAVVEGLGKDQNVVHALIEEYNEIVDLFNAANEEEGVDSKAKVSVGRILRAAKSLEERELRSVKSDFLAKFNIDVKGFLDAVRQAKRKGALKEDGEIAVLLNDAHKKIRLILDPSMIGSRGRNISAATTDLLACKGKIAQFAPAATGRKAGLFDIGKEVLGSMIRRPSSSSPPKGESFSPTELERLEDSMKLTTEIDARKVAEAKYGDKLTFVGPTKVKNKKQESSGMDRSPPQPPIVGSGQKKSPPPVPSREGIEVVGGKDKKVATTDGPPPLPPRPGTRPGSHNKG